MKEGASNHKQKKEDKTMQIGLYIIIDMNAQLIAGVPMMERRPEPAIRSFNSLLEREGTMLNRYPEDYELRYLGEMDDETGTITPIRPQTIATGRAWEMARRERVMDETAQNMVRPITEAFARNQEREGSLREQR